MKKKTFDDLYQSHIKDVFRYLLSLCGDYYLAEDLVNETFYRAYLFLDDCREDKCKPWLFKVAYHAYIDFRRKNSRILLKDRTYFDALKETETPEGSYIRQEQLHQISQLIAALPEHQKQAILLYDFHGLHYKEAAEIMQISVGYFKVLLFRARQKVREQRGGMMYFE